MFPELESRKSANPNHSNSIQFQILPKQRRHQKRLEASALGLNFSNSFRGQTQRNTGAETDQSSAAFCPN